MTPQEREKVAQKLHLLEGIQTALDNWDEVSARIYSAEDRKAAVEALGQSPVSLTDFQAYMVVDTPLSQRTQEGRRQLQEEIERLKAILSEE